MNTIDEQLLKDVASGKTTVTCGTHLYTGRGPLPSQGCPKCNLALFLSWFSKVPAAKFAEEVAKFSAVVRHMCEEEDQGRLDYQPYQHPRIEYNKKDN